MIPLAFHEDTQTDIENAIRECSEVSWIVVSRFEAELKEVFAKIRVNPSHFHFTHDRVFRRANLRQFPYRVLYHVDQEQGLVRIMGVCQNKSHALRGLDRQ